MNGGGKPPLPPGVLLFTAYLMVLPFYLAAGWFVLKLSDGEKIAPEYRFTAFAVACAAALAAAVFSNHWKNRRQGRGFMFAMMLSEIPAFLGLVYLWLSRDVRGFALLLLIAAGAFTWHALKRGNRATL